MAEEKSCSSASSCSRESCEGCPSKQNPQSFLVDANVYSEIKKVIGVVSGKGGVGKSMVAASMANMLASKGYRVGILDADITGPSIPKMYGLKGPAMADDEGIYPMLTENDIKVMSVNLMLPDEESPVIWRGPVIANMVKQFWSDVIWGELDYLLVDMPPGTGDVPLTVFQSLPVDGIVIVSSPQDLVRMIVKKAYNMAKTMNIPVLGIVENYSYLKCPDCGKEIAVFGESHIEEIASELGTEVLGKMPIDPEFAKAADGNFAAFTNQYLDKAMEVLRK
ncbi:MAG: Mrp/NBP35 family ATP-binding protein [Eubacteriales bacterium]|nr:Mrp/NBP35 family ATP-binding protein [Eubacteriales bacterium]